MGWCKRDKRKCIGEICSMRPQPKESETYKDCPEFINNHNLYKHAWYTVDHGMGIRCEKCGEYANMEWTHNFYEIEHTNDCPVEDGLVWEHLMCSKCKIKDCDNCPC